MAARSKGGKNGGGKSASDWQQHIRAATDWQKITERAAAFAEEWQGETRENAEAQTFWNEFFAIFGRSRRGLAWYEYHAKTRGGASSNQPHLPGDGRVDMLWPGVLAVEHKSAGKNMDAGERQLRDYIDALADNIKPDYGLVCDFARFRLIDAKRGEHWNFTLAELPQYIGRFGFFVDERERRLFLELQASKDAVRLMARIYDDLQESGYGEDTDLLLMRLLFCMFADDTGIFPRHSFEDSLQKHTGENGDGLGGHLNTIFEILNKPVAKRQKNTPPHLAVFPHVNGDLFAGGIDTVMFRGSTRAAILEACAFDWSKISPDIFGALFQTVRDAKARHEGGEHYTSEANIMKVIRPLFLDKLRDELTRAGYDKRALQRLHDKIAAMRFFDPACGCGNFLIVAYRELRRLEMEIIALLHPEKRALDISVMTRVNVDQFYGVEIDPFPARIAQTAMWLTDHQMNRETSDMFGKTYMRLPLKKSPGITIGNALCMEWRDIVKPDKLSCIFGNPPFVDRKNRAAEQRRDMKSIFGNIAGAGNLDYVASWYLKAAHYIRGADIRCAFVSTDSITQSMQASVLWRALYAEGIKIHFAHRPFKWSNEASDNAQVYVVIIGFGNNGNNGKVIYEYDDGRGEPRAVAAANINAYLRDDPDILITRRSEPLCRVPPMLSGSNPIDEGHLLLSPHEKRDMLREYPQAKPFIRPAMGGAEFLRDTKRWCLWLADGEPSAFRNIRPIRERMEKTRQFRRQSDRETTRAMADMPHLFGENRQPDSGYLVVPQTTSGSRLYIPMGFATAKTIALIKCQIVPRANLFHLGVLSSAMHMAWVRTVGGRLGDGYSYTASLVYNTFPWPEDAPPGKKEKIKECARAVLDIRKKYSLSNLADMYSNMPSDLHKAHRALDLAVDRAYRSRPFPSEQERIAHLFAEYARLTTPAIPKPKKRRKRKPRD